MQMLADPCCGDPSHGNGNGCVVYLSAGFLSTQNAVHWFNECHKRHPAQGEPKRRKEALAIRTNPQDELMSQQTDRRPSHRKGKLIHIGPMARWLPLVGTRFKISLKGYSGSPDCKIAFLTIPSHEPRCQFSRGVPPDFPTTLLEPRPWF